ncbi:uncharacterized protein CIMG_13093 [Coccidioides immitis RS]|uniref:Uncharacterized protein n=1 Tax=Coccidioides immitis (strain RS) TaxID=246410 RepID=J3K9A4_COCIM|nr:uncharacterized protein CIMG_13093 [Coccidioides immitis RS]EAS31464.3 hypothetical protein CIMG_13093 [Coccidioides immitis RS]
MLIRLCGFETDQSQLLFEFTSMLANPSSQSEAPKYHSERIAAMLAHQILQDLDDNDEFEQQLLQKIKSIKMCSELELICILEQLEKVFSDKKANIYLYYDHAKLMTSKLRLQTHTLNREKLLNYLTHIYRNCCNIDSVKTNDSIYLWFCLTNKLARAEDALDIYKFNHQPIISLVTNMRMFDFN